MHGSEVRAHRLTGIVTKHPTMVQQMMQDMAALLTTISHWARVTTGFKTGVNGVAKIGTALNACNRGAGVLMSLMFLEELAIAPPLSFSTVEGASTQLVT